MPPAYVKPYIKRQKNDATDAEAICEAVTRANMRFVPTKTPEQQSGWGGINNTYFWIDPSRGISGIILMLYLPCADAKALAVYDAFERGAYQLVNANQ